ncbi:MAG: hypothetical protein IH866_04280 [Chloroflexi bacterium]|nr:hypothetical protein [Chloroflexota bacterium]
MAALLITVLLGLVGLAVDAGFAYAQRRQTQNAADEAALAGAHRLLEGGSIASAISAAHDYVHANGFSISASCPSICIPPLSGPHAGDPTFVEVTVEDQPTSFFIQALIPGGSTVRARGVAGYPLFPEPYALIVLDADDCRAFRMGGSASMTISGGGIMVNSDCGSDAFRKTGSGDLLVDGSIDVAGGVDCCGSGSVSPSPNANRPWTVTDPLASLAPPDPAAYTAQGAGTAAVPETWKHTSGGDLILSPGTYYGGFSSNCTCTIYMDPGVYIMAGGGFTKSGGVNFVGAGVTIYVTENPTNPTGDGEPEPFKLTGSGVLDLSPPTSGIYQGITLWQDVAITDDFKMTGSNDLISGILYAPGAQLDISGNSQFGTVQIVVNGFELSGNAPLDLTYGEFRTFEAPKVVLVE